jgi:hypothetical protein
MKSPRFQFAETAAESHRTDIAHGWTMAMCADSGSTFLQ